MYYCHVFMAGSVVICCNIWPSYYCVSYIYIVTLYSQEISDEIIMTIGQAFEIAYQKVLKARTRTPPK